jgi:cytoskeletal protein CcmA (bactofilin family)
MAIFGKKTTETDDLKDFSPQSPSPKPPSAPPKAKGTPPAAPTQVETTYLGKKLKIKGNVSGEGNLVLMGEFDGEFNLKGKLKIAQDALVKGTVKANAVSVNGNVEGNLKATERVQLEQTARIQGSIEAPKISIIEGAKFNGEIKMGGAFSQPTPSVAASSKPPEGALPEKEKIDQN